MNREAALLMPSRLCQQAGNEQLLFPKVAASKLATAINAQLLTHPSLLLYPRLSIIAPNSVLLEIELPAIPPSLPLTILSLCDYHGILDFLYLVPSYFSHLSPSQY